MTKVCPSLRASCCSLPVTLCLYKVALKFVSFVGCSAGGEGGAIAIVNSTFVGSQLRVSSSSSSGGGGGGGALAFVFSQATLTASTIDDNFVSSSSNSSSKAAGAVACRSSTLSFRGVIMYNNGGRGLGPSATGSTVSDWSCSSCVFTASDFGYRFLGARLQLFDAEFLTLPQPIPLRRPPAAYRPPPQPRRCKVHIASAPAFPRHPAPNQRELTACAGIHCT